MGSTHSSRGRGGARQPKAKTRERPADRRSTRLELLYAIGKKLARASSPEEALPEILSIAAAALSLRSAILALRMNGGIRVIAWPTNGTEIDVASNHALAVFAYLLQEPELASRGVEIRRGALVGRHGNRVHALGTQQFVVLPLAVAQRPIFGALQLESAALLGEADLSFADSIVTEIAAALDRTRNVEIRVAQAERSRYVAESVARTARKGAALAEERETHSREERDFARAVTRSLAEGVVAVGLDAKITLLNPAAEALLGWTEAEALGRDIAQVVPVRDGDGTPIAADDGPVAQVMCRSVETRDDTHLFVHRTGAAIPVSFAASPIFREGILAGAVIAFENVSLLRRAEYEQRTLAALSASLGATLEFSDAVAAVCRALVPRFADMCFIDVALGGGRFERSDVVFADAAKKPLADRLRAQFPTPNRSTPQSQVLATGKPVLIADADALLANANEAEERDVLRDVGVTSQIVVPLRTEDQVFGTLTCGMIGSGRVYRVVDAAVAQDIARRAALALEHARLYEAARAATRAREDVLAVVSHDLRNPLVGIVLGADTLLRSLAKGDLAKSREKIEMIARAGKRMDAQVERLLDFSRIESGNLTLSLEETDVRSLLAEAVGTVEPIADQKNIALKTDVDAAVPRVRCDADRMQQVLGNLLGNALKFTPNGGAITVRARLVEGEVRLSVTDTGPGITEGERSRIFQAYWQARPGRRSGAGLGLAIARGIVESHGGRIWVESPPGAGSTFVIALPVSKVDKRKS